MEARSESGSQCPYDWFRELRQSRPVAELQPGMFAVTRCADVRAVLADPKTFSARVGGNNPFALFRPSPVQDQLDEIMRAYPEEPVLMRTDPPAHTRVRSLVNRVFTPAAVDKIEPQIQAIVDELAAPWIRSG